MEKEPQIDPRTLPRWASNVDILDYLCLFERAMRQNRVEQSKYLKFLTPLVQDKVAVNILASLSEEATYQQFKDALTRRLALTSDGLRRRFRQFKRQPGDSLVVVISQLEHRLDLWLQAEKVMTLQQLRNVVLKEQFYSLLSVDLTAMIEDQKPDSPQKAADLGDAILARRPGDFNLRRVPEQRPRFDRGWEKRQYDIGSHREQREVQAISQELSAPHESSRTVCKGLGQSKERGRLPLVDTVSHITCFFCKEPGHVKRDCEQYKARGDAKGGRPQVRYIKHPVVEDMAAVTEIREQEGVAKALQDVHEEVSTLTGLGGSTVTALANGQSQNLNKDVVPRVVTSHQREVVAESGVVAGRRSSVENTEVGVQEALGTVAQCSVRVNTIFLRKPEGRREIRPDEWITPEQRKWASEQREEDVELFHGRMKVRAVLDSGADVSCVSRTLITEDMICKDVCMGARSYATSTHYFEVAKIHILIF